MQRGSTLSVTLTAQGAGTVNGSALDLNVDAGATVGVTVAITAQGGTPSTAVSLQWSADGTNFGPADPADSMTAITTTGVISKSFTVKARYCRAVATVSGTTPSVTGTIVLQPFE